MASRPALSYYVQTAPSLNPGAAWTTLQTLENVSGLNTLLLSNATSALRFYRLQVRAAP